MHCVYDGCLLLLQVLGSWSLHFQDQVVQGLFNPDDCSTSNPNISPEYWSLCSHVSLLHYLGTNTLFHIFYLNVIFHTLFPLTRKMFHVLNYIYFAILFHRSAKTFRYNMWCMPWRSGRFSLQVHSVWQLWSVCQLWGQGFSSWPLHDTLFCSHIDQTGKFWSSSNSAGWKSRVLHHQRLMYALSQWSEHPDSGIIYAVEKKVWNYFWLCSITWEGLRKISRIAWQGNGLPSLCISQSVLT
jgi:hypothetical protein